MNKHFHLQFPVLFILKTCSDFHGLDNPHFVNTISFTIWQYFPPLWLLVLSSWPINVCINFLEEQENCICFLLGSKTQTFSTYLNSTQGKSEVFTMSNFHSLLQESTKMMSAPLFVFFIHSSKLFLLGELPQHDRDYHSTIP